MAKKETKYYKYSLVIIIILFTIFIVYDVYFNNKVSYNLNGKNGNILAVKEPLFTKHGELTFIKSNNENYVKKIIDIEIADTDTTREQGLMYRNSMQDNQGMLFIFDYPSIHSFWMKNTLISLDIIFVDNNNKIINIYRNTIKKSLTSLPSLRPALYVIEVNSGFTDKYGISEGDKIYFTRK